MHVILVNDRDVIVGYREKYAAHKIPVPMHRAISVVILDRSGRKMLLQKRAGGKPTWPLFWSNAVCTHPLKSESYQACAKRRLKQEMGFTTPLGEKLRFIYRANFDKIWGEHEYDVVFEGRYEGEIKVDQQEVTDWKWMEVKELLRDVINNPVNYTPWFRLILKKLYGQDQLIEAACDWREVAP